LTKTLNIINIWEEDNPAGFSLVGMEQEVKQGEISADVSSKALANDNIKIIA
jgi:hypothetical protein